MFKKIVTIICLIFVMNLTILQLVSFANDEFPSTIWKPLDKFAVALNNSDDIEMLKWGELVVDIMESEGDSATKKEFLAGKYEQLSRCAERLGLFEKAIGYYKKYLPLGEYMNWTDGVIFANMKIKLLESRLDLFVETNGYKPQYFGAKFEPKSGVIFGSAYDNDSRILDYNSGVIQKYFPKKNSSYLMYLEFGEDIATTPRYPRYFADAKKNNVAVSLAWNTYTSDIQGKEEYIKKTIDYLGNSGLKIFLRFACEMNIGPSGDDASAYIKGYRFVAEYAKTKNNIAMVWSPNDLGALDRPFENYYPGDEYVDWVGVSLYTIKYFQGVKDHGEMTDALNTYFMTGEFSNPVLRLKPIMEFMDKKNIQKPVMISECGTPHFIRTENEDTTNWANLQLKRLYGEVIRVYPNIKMMSYFNVDIKSEPNVYALYNNETLNNTYNELVSTPYFLSNLEDEANFGYKPFVGGEYFNDEIIKLSAFAYYPKEFYNEVRYVVDGNLVYATSNPPYELNLDTATIGSGNHTLGVELYVADKKRIEKQLPINIVPNIKVEVNGNKVAFKDQKPVIIDGRTLVPVRGVFENLGMTVEWVQSEQKVILTRKDTTISLLIGKDELTITTLNGTKSVKMDVPAQLINNRTMVPVRAISEAANAKVDWDSNLQTVLVKTN